MHDRMEPGLMRVVQVMAERVDAPSRIVAIRGDKGDGDQCGTGGMGAGDAVAQEVAQWRGVRRQAVRGAVPIGLEIRGGVAALGFTYAGVMQPGIDAAWPG